MLWRRVVIKDVSTRSIALCITLDMVSWKPLGRRTDKSGETGKFHITDTYNWIYSLQQHSKLCLRAGRPGFNSRKGQGNFLFATASIPALWPTQPPIQWVPRDISPGINRPGREPDHSTQSGADDKNVWSYTFIPPTCLHSAVLS
jgi:hypothetical protein